MFNGINGPGFDFRFPFLAGILLWGVYVFSLFLHGLPPVIPASSYGLKICKLALLVILNCACRCKSVHVFHVKYMWLFVSICQFCELVQGVCCLLFNNSWERLQRLLEGTTYSPLQKYSNSKTNSFVFVLH